MAEPELVVEQEFQYSSLFDQGQTAVVGMWLFLAQECLFFGALFLTWVYARYWNQAGFDAGSHETQLWIGSINLGILVTSSFVYACALAFVQAGRPRAMTWALGGVAALGVAFLCWKLYEWHLDFAAHDWVNDPEFPIHGELEGGAKLFWTFYWIATVLHGFHLTVGIGLLAYLIRRARRGDFTASYHAPVEVIGLYWSFVDIIWIILWPMIYLIGRVT
jgi:cytochrome c oxidase subunit III